MTAPVTQCNNSSVACQGQFPDISYVVEGSFESFYYLVSAKTSIQGKAVCNN